MAQLFAQQDRQPDVWVMSGAPTATVVYLSLQTTINYSSGSPDTLPANTPAVIYGTSDTAFDRSLDVWVPLTVRGSNVLSIIKESLLATITADYVAMSRVELHGIKPYQPEPYLASGGGGALGATSTTVVSTVGQGKVLDLAGGSAPANWYTRGYDDSAWAAPLAGSSSSTLRPSGSAWVSYSAGAVPDDEIWLLRHTFSLPPGALDSATLLVTADNYILDVYVNGTRLYGPGYGVNLYDTTIASVSGVRAALVAGDTNTLAIRVQNENLHGAPQGGSVAYRLDAGGTFGGAIPDPGGAEGALLYLHHGAWTDLPIGTSGQELTVVSGDPAWATPAASGSVSSVAFAGPTGTSVSGSPITSSGTIALSWASQSANTVLGAPNGSSGAPTFRALVGADIPVDASTIISSAGVIKGNYQAGSGVTISGNTISAAGSGGTVTSVALSMPGIFSVSGSPISTSGTLTVTLATESANTVLAGPTSGSAAPTFRALAAADLPTAPTAGGHVHAHGHFL